MTPYHVRQLNSQGAVLKETRIDAEDGRKALGQLDSIVKNTARIEVYNTGGERVGEIEAGFWRQRLGRKMR